MPKKKTAHVEPKVSEPWRNRIVRYSDESPEQLLASPKNFRIHPLTQQKAMEGVLDQIGYIAPVVCTEQGTVIDGHLRVAIAISKGQPTVPVAFCDLSEEEADLAIATFDPISAMAGTDRELLADLLADVETENEALQGLLDNLMGSTAQSGEEQTGDGLLDPSGEEKEAITSGAKLRWGKQQIPLTDEELELLNTRLKEHVSESGTNFGFVFRILGKAA